MSKVRLYGSTSGYIELAAPAVAPDSTLTLPATAGGFGKVVDVKTAVKTDTFSASVTAGSSVEVTGLSITHEVANAANRLIIFATFGAAATSTEATLVGIGVYDGSAFIDVGDTAGSRTSAGGAGALLAASGGIVATTAVHTPGAGSVTYSIHALNVAAGTRTLYVNRKVTDTDGADVPRTASSLIIYEVAA